MKKDSIIRLFPQKLRPYFCQVAAQIKDLNEIRIRSDRPVIIVRDREEYYLTENGTEIPCRKLQHQEMQNEACDNVSGQKNKDAEIILKLTQLQTERLFQHICQDSPYAHDEELKKGYITLSGGHRVGVAGQVLSDRGKVMSIRNIRFLNIRITHEMIGCANQIMDSLYDSVSENWFSTLIIGPPACGKTTLMRDIIRQISDGTGGRKGVTVGLVDERSEIAGCFYGTPQNDVGMRTDVLDGCPKVCGMEMLLRSMAPMVIAVDEIGGEEDVRALLQVVHSGIKLLVTIHGDDLQEIREKKHLRPLFEMHCFQRFLLVSPDHHVTASDETMTGGKIVADDDVTGSSEPDK